MDTKALKKQMGAAIAMVLVAAIALGSATFAWFVTNSKVDATTKNISAQSNAAFMTITNGATGARGVDTTSATTQIKGDVSLYPATFGEETGAAGGIFQSAYGTNLDDGAKKGDFVTVGANGTPDEADTNLYAKKEQFNVSSKGQNLSDLKVDSVETQAEATGNNQLLDTALRVLVTSADGQSWVVYGLKSDKSGYEIKLSSDTQDQKKNSPSLGDVTAGSDTVVNVYLYYEGSDTSIKTRNLQDNKLTNSQSVKINFTATAKNK